MIKDIKNKEYEFIKVLKETNRRSFGGNVIWEIECCCGNKKFWTKRQIERNKSCGCKRQELHRRKVWKGCGEISGQHFSSIRKNARDRGLSFKITVKDVWEIFLKQNRICPLSGEPLHFGTDSERQTASLDRIDSEKGYTIDNVQWLHKKVNFMKQQFPEKDFLDWCRKIVQHNK